MSPPDDDIRADFLAEAGELVEQLGEQLIGLEQNPQDIDLLNAVFRAFHTVKGGAGFLMVSPLVEICHAAEDVLNIVRSGQRSFDTAVMDAVSQALDVVHEMMEALREDRDPAVAPPELIEMLHGLAVPAAAAPAPAAKTAPPPAVAAGSDEITEDEFDALLDQLQGKPAATAAPAVPAAAPVAGGNSITEDEFEALLDQLQGKAAAAPAAAAPAAVPAARPAPVTAPPAAPPRPPAATAPAAPAAPRSETETVRVETQKLDRLMNLVGELVLVRNRLKAMRGGMGEDSVRAIGELDFITRGLQDVIMQARMQPIRKVFSRFPKIARDIARQLGKQIEVVLEGEDTELDKNLVEALADPLVHMVRNSVDHGIEMPDARSAAGKPTMGRLTLSARQEGSEICIDIRDDGAGIDPERVRRKAIEKGVVDSASAAQLTADDCLQLIFLPGFSTVDKVSDLSGRGVGMDVVQSSIKRLHGTIHLESKPGVGTTFRISVPLTLAILPALIVRADGRRFAVPLAPIADVFALDPKQVKRFERWDIVMLRDQPLRLVYMERWLQSPVGTGPHHVVTAQVGEERYGFVVREVLGREEIVIKPLGASLRGLAGVAGATVMPDGCIALILDFAGMVAAYRAQRGSLGAGAHG
ncbi:two-component system, chemotaxis family, sensor kinase CheA [Solimonas aquatica]|uniref:Chemotaxis protein CheA n=1 Tax=Solimonas aquatica TaxID=489703 RepID=A0A1H9ATY4_9GAMM|nr:chemotaxis protein CheA [Solimonas aquatica]SEP79985.1 two-component system, chemotaxis family, sensor kinase CheA [Solimonas aquatica]